MAKEKKMYKLERYCYKFGGNFFFFYNRIRRVNNNLKGMMVESNRGGRVVEF